MKKVFIIVCIAVFACSLFAQEAVIKTVKGKVEVSTDGKAWTPAKPEQVIKKGSYISTSFKSSAVIIVNGSIINVKALTRMNLDELTKTPDGPQTELYLVSGKVQVEVKPAADNEITTFKVKSAMATASVRGTGFEFDGVNLLVNHGAVQLMDNLGVSRSVNGGEFGNAGKRGKMPEPVAVKKPSAPVLTSDSTDEDIQKAVENLGSILPDTGADDLLSLASELFPDTGSSPKPDDMAQIIPGPSLPTEAAVIITVY